jgi:hypothetical protein
VSKAKKRRTTYRTKNWKAYNAALKARGALTLWLDRDMQWLAAPSGKRGRQRTFSDAAIQFCLSIKGLFRLALRQTLGLVESLLRLAGLDWPVPDYSTVCRRQKTLQVQIGYRPGAQPLQLLVDSTGIQFLGEGEWKRRKHGAEYRREWRKVHLGIDAQTLEIRAVEVTSNTIGDAPMLPGRDRPARGAGGDSSAQERQPVAPAQSGRRVSQRSGACVQPAGQTDLEDLERLPPAQPGGDQDALPQAPGRAGHGAHLRASGGGAACARGPAQPLRSDRPGADRAGGRRGMSPSGVGVMASAGCFVQQSRSAPERSEGSLS